MWLRFLFRLKGYFRHCGITSAHYVHEMILCVRSLSVIWHFKCSLAILSTFTPGETTIKYAAVGLQFMHVFMRSKCVVKWECLTRWLFLPTDTRLSAAARFTCLHCVTLSGCLSNTAAVMFDPGFTCTYAVITEHQENVRLNAGDEQYWVKMIKHYHWNVSY